MLFLLFVWENYQCLLPWYLMNKISVVIFQLYFEKKTLFDFTYLNVCWIPDNSVTKLVNEEYVYQIIKRFNTKWMFQLWVFSLSASEFVWQSVQKLSDYLKDMVILFKVHCQLTRFHIPLFKEYLIKMVRMSDICERYYSFICSIKQIVSRQNS